jgi:AraC family transcriptional regulator
MTADSRLSWDQADERAGATVLSTSGPRLPGLVVKRTVAERSTDMVPSAQDTHIVCVHNNSAINMEWHDGGRIRHCLIHPGDVIVNPAGYVEGRAWDGRSEDVRVGLALDSAHLGSSASKLRPAIGVHDPLLAQLGRYLARTLEMGASADSLYADALAHALGAHLLAYYSDRATPKELLLTHDARLPRRQLDTVFDYIECNLHRSLTVAELAAIADASPSHFTRMFRAACGESPHRYVRTRRLDLAERLIAGSQLSLAAIASCAGFSDQSHLNRVMRAERGRTPRQYRQSLLS